MSVRRATAVVVLFMAWAGMTGEAGAGIIENTFGSTGQLSAGGRRATVDVLLACTDGSVRFEVNLAQGDTVGVGHGAGVCTGDVETYTVTIPARDRTFAAGEATACGEAVNRERGGGTDTRSWCRATPVALS